MFFTPKVLDDHASEKTQNFRKIAPSFSSILTSMDSVTTNRGKRFAKSITGANRQQDRLKKVKDRKSFWKIAPDGKTILCTYDSNQEPIVELGVGNEK